MRAGPRDRQALRERTEGQGCVKPRAVSVDTPLPALPTAVNDRALRLLLTPLERNRVHWCIPSTSAGNGRQLGCSVRPRRSSEKRKGKRHAGIAYSTRSRPSPCGRRLHRSLEQTEHGLMLRGNAETGAAWYGVSAGACPPPLHRSPGHARLRPVNADAAGRKPPRGVCAGDAGLHRASLRLGLRIRLCQIHHCIPSGTLTGGWATFPLRGVKDGPAHA
jgi:hypothetical protein